MKRNKCIIDECSYPRWAKGLCKFHQHLRTDKKVHSNIPPKSAKMIKKLSDYRVKRDKYLAEHPICEFEGCGSDKVETHHMRGRVGDLLTDERWFKALCRKHHQWVENNPLEAKKLGLSYDRLTA